MKGIIEIQYDIEKGDYNLNSNLKYKGISEVLGSYIRTQFGKGEDDSKPNEKDCYNLQLGWEPKNDKLIFSSDTGNKGLDLGILLDVFRDF